ncbi:DUF6900 domain-containing protein [Corynebacterium sp. LK2510]|uniref:DUF6900 domain-containing protein n=1 Tax=Corynebacterium sp. LK2510 TaxID=3110472 RepID=UPI0034CD8445
MTTTTISREALNQLLTEITSERFNYIPTLEQRLSDELDFPEVSVWGLKHILTKAFEAGLEAGNQGITTITD